MEREREKKREREGERGDLGAIVALWTLADVSTRVYMYVYYKFVYVLIRLIYGLYSS